MSNEQQSTALTVQPEQYNDRQMAIIRNQIAKGASPDELGLFLEVCRLTGLNPFQKQIYAIMRGGKMTIQTGIDGYRLVAARTGQLAGIDDPIYDSEDADRPKRASVTVWRFVSGQRVPFTATARWNEYAQSGGLWPKMPYLMLGKCAESLALRKAFPAELSGVYTGEEMAQADADIGPYVEAEPAPTPQRIAPPTQMRRPAPVVTEQPTQQPTARDGKPTQQQIAAIDKMCKALGRELPDDLTFQSASALIAALSNELRAKRQPRVVEAGSFPTEDVEHDLSTLDTDRVKVS